MAIKKSELYSSLWKSCDELRGSMDASQYKDYVLVLLFVKYVSDKYAGRQDAMVVVPKGGGFADMIALQGNKEIGDRINKIISKLADANGLKGVIDQTDFNDPAKLGSGKDMIERLSNLVGIFDNPDLNFSRNRADGDDLLGDAYEYLMRNFATEAGKSKGQFYTPSEVSRVMAKVIGLGGATRSSQTIYDPTCGSGSLLIKAHDEGKHATGADLTIYGQENDLATWALARMNMFLHDCPSADIWKGNTLSGPHFRDQGGLKTFDFVVANPPFSSKTWSTGVNTADDPYGRFPYGVPPKKNGDYAFLLQILASLKSTGKGAIILPHGVLFRGNAEGDIRRQIVKRGYIKGVIGLPANLFYGTGIPACIVVLDKEGAAQRKGIFMIDASKGFLKEGNKNRLRDMDIHKIVDTFNSQAELSRFSRMVSIKEIEANDFNLNIPRYIDSNEPEDVQDIGAHIRGGIPIRDLEALEKYWTVFPTMRAVLIQPVKDRPYAVMTVSGAEIQPAIFGHPEFEAYQRSISKLIAKWKIDHLSCLNELKVSDKPKALILELSESLLQTFRRAKLVDPYDIYQKMMNYWSATMQDDVYQIVERGWHSYLDDAPNYDLIPTHLVISQYFNSEQDAINGLVVEREGIAVKLDEIEAEHGGDDGLLVEARTDRGKLSQISVKSRISKISKDPDAKEELVILKLLMVLIDSDNDLKRRIKEAQTLLDRAVLKKYQQLTKAEIRHIVVERKWLTSLSHLVRNEQDRVSHSLTDRLQELAARYATPLPTIAKATEAFSKRVDGHLIKMGFKW